MAKIKLKRSEVFRKFDGKTFAVVSTGTRKAEIEKYMKRYNVRKRPDIKFRIVKKKSGWFLYTWTKKR